MLTMESFGAHFPRIYMDSAFKGWWVSTLLLGAYSVAAIPNRSPSSVVRHQLGLTLEKAAWFGSLANGPVADRLGRKLSINIAVVIFVIGSAIQCGAVNIPMLFVGMSSPRRGNLTRPRTRSADSLVQVEPLQDWPSVN